MKISTALTLQENIMWIYYISSSLYFDKSKEAVEGTKL